MRSNNEAAVQSEAFTDRSGSILEEYLPYYINDINAHSHTHNTVDIRH